MISSNNPDIDVDKLMERVRAEVAAMRALSASHESARSMLDQSGGLPAIVVDLSRHAVVTELVEDAARKSKPRTAVPRRLERAPLSVLRPLVRFGLRVLNYTQKDQRHVNAATQQALRELLRLSVAIGNHVGQLSTLVHAQRNAARDLASLDARVTASEQREAAFFDRFGDIDQRIASRLDALEIAVHETSVSELVTARLDALEASMTINAGRLDTLETGALPGRVDALEHAMTINAGRIDTMETEPAAGRVAALEHAMTLNAGRIDALETESASGRVAALELAMTLNAGRIDALETEPASGRVSALEHAMTHNAGRIDALETGAIFGQVAALEHAMTLNAGRIDALETRPVDARLLGLETAQTISSQRLERLEIFREQSAAVVTRLDETRGELSAERERALRTEASLRSELTAQLTAANTLIAHAGVPDAARLNGDLPMFAAPDAARYENVHLALADRFRGDSTTIAAMLDRYVALVLEAGTVDDTHPLLDVGSGRGEWLATLSNAGIASFGLDTNAVLVARAQEDGLDVRRGDALSLLRAMPPASLGAISAFHVIEHLPFEQMIAFFDESLRVLVPGGLLMCETPNPANMTIGACNFYLDPTHIRPLPSPLVAHVVSLRGFDRVRIDELAANEAMRIDEDSETARRVNDFFYGPQNYAVIANKPGAAH